LESLGDVTAKLKVLFLVIADRKWVACYRRNVCAIRTG